MRDPWVRSDLTITGLGRGLVVREPRIALTCWGDDYVLTGPDGRTRTGIALGAVLEWCREHGIEGPTTEALAWLTEGPRG